NGQSSMRHALFREAGQVGARVAAWLAVIALLLGLIALLSGAFGLRLRGPGHEHDLVGAWRATIDFESGAFAAFDDLEFMYAFNAGGTMAECSKHERA